jgi:hypothetical protein
MAAFSPGVRLAHPEKDKATTTEAEEILRSLKFIKNSYFTT